MRLEEEIGDALTTALSVSDTPPPPSTLLATFAEVIGADRCEVRLGLKALSWSARDAAPDDDIGILRLGTNPDIIATVTPARAMPSPEAWQPLLLLLTPYAAEDGMWHARRQQQEAARRIDDVRWRASADMEHERRRLERDLHDGAQHHLVALRLAMAFADHRQAEDGAEERLAALRDQLDETERLLISTARGVLPPVLARGGLSGALAPLEAQDLEVHADISRLMPVVESALYFFTLEAVGNARRHAAGAHIVVEARLEGGRAFVSVSDDGPGFTASGEAGGLAYLAQRIEAVGGTLEVDSSPGAGTRLSASVPY